MKLEGERALLRIHLSNFLKRRGRPLYEEIAERARREHLAGATVLAGTSGYFGMGPILGDHPGALAVERPVIVEMVDDLDALERFLDGIEELLRRQPAIVTLERARVARDRGPTRAQGGAEEDAP
jgi:PII-like signaling protein